MSSSRTRDLSPKRRRTEDGNREGRKHSDPSFHSPVQAIYRDKSGRKIDIKLMRIEEQRKEAEEAALAASRHEWGSGLIQQEEKKQLLKDYQENLSKPMTLNKDDVEYNEQLKREIRWDDPARTFVTAKTMPKDRHTISGAKSLFKGNFKPNRFGIRPGHLWDGIDRSNGFEDRIFAKAAAKESVKEKIYQYSTEDL